jgi:hypothetical protein
LGYPDPAFRPVDAIIGRFGHPSERFTAETQEDMQTRFPSSIVLVTWHR